MLVSPSLAQSSAAYSSAAASAAPSAASSLAAHGPTGFDLAAPHTPPLTARQFVEQNIAAFVSASVNTPWGHLLTVELIQQLTRQLLEAANSETHVHLEQVKAAAANDLLLLASPQQAKPEPDDSDATAAPRPAPRSRRTQGTPSSLRSLNDSLAVGSGYRTGASSTTAAAVAASSSSGMQQLSRELFPAATNAHAAPAAPTAPLARPSLHTPYPSIPLRPLALSPHAPKRKREDEEEAQGARDGGLRRGADSLSVAEDKRARRELEAPPAAAASAPAAPAVPSVDSSDSADRPASPHTASLMCDETDLACSPLLDRVVQAEQAAHAATAAAAAQEAAAREERIEAAAAAAAAAASAHDETPDAQLYRQQERAVLSEMAGFLQQLVQRVSAGKEQYTGVLTATTTAAARPAPSQVAAIGMVE